MPEAEGKKVEIPVPVPKEIAERLVVTETHIYASKELGGNRTFDLWFAQLCRVSGKQYLVSFYPPREFDSLFMSKTEKKKSRGESDMMQYAIDMIATAYKLKVSDIHITYYGPYTIIAFRRLGLLRDYTQLQGEDGLSLIRCLFQSQLSQSEANWSVYDRYDARIANRDYLPDGLFAVRMHSEPIQSGLMADPGCTVALRLLFDATGATGSLEERFLKLGYTDFHADIVHAFTRRSGLNMIAGPTGSGKSTALKNVMEFMTDDMQFSNFYSLEDPPEFVIPRLKQILVSSKASIESEREAGLLNAVAGMMRADPDIAMIGEIRFLALANAGMSMARTGHNVWATIHANSALGILNRLMDMGVQASDLCDTSVVNGLVMQRLLPVLCTQCKIRLVDHKDMVRPAMYETLKKLLDNNLDNVYLKGPGCEHCDHYGVIGQKIAAETIQMNSALFPMIYNKEIYKAKAHWMFEMGGKTYLQHALGRIMVGDTDPVLAEERLGTALDTDYLEAQQTLGKNNDFKAYIEIPYVGDNLKGIPDGYKYLFEKKNTDDSSDAVPIAGQTKDEVKPPKVGNA